MIKKVLRDIIGDLLIKYGNDIKNNSCILNDDEIQPLLDLISHKRLSKEEACRYLNISRSKFDLYVLEHRLPKGVKVAGFKELIWYLDELAIRAEIIKRLQSK